MASGWRQIRCYRELLTQGFCRVAGPGVLETCLPGPDLAGFAEDAAGPRRDYPGLTDDELIGRMLAWGKLESWAGAGKLSAMAELSRRRAAVGREAATRRGTPAPWSKYCSDEIAAALALSRWISRQRSCPGWAAGPSSSTISWYCS